MHSSIGDAFHIVMKKNEHYEPLTSKSTTIENIFHSCWETNVVIVREAFSNLL